MGFLKSGELIDYTYLQKRGLLKKEEAKKREIGKVTKDGYIELNSPTTVGNKQTMETLGNQFDFLDNLAGTNANSTSEGIENKNFDEMQIQHLKVKLEDFEYKLDRLIERLNEIEEKLNRL
ncbi:hypothetical protein HYV50_00180 [Candidatus Pacearchaeota archaeon]|nr:hypothetical protein [Candidatus Pacearchaeota archaeon]